VAPVRCLVAAVFAFVAAGTAQGATPATLRVDIQHGGNATREHYAIERVVVEPLPWPGNPARPLDDSNRGLNRFEVLDAKSGKLLYSRGYSTIFGEWRTTGEAKTTDRAFQESLRFPMPTAPVMLRIATRDGNNAFATTWSATIDPGALDVVRQVPPAPVAPIAIHESGSSDKKVDLLIIGDGYTAAEMGKFEADARRLSAHLFTVSPFRERAADFNVWALAVPTAASGVPRPSEGKDTPSSIGTRYDIFGSERYVLTLDNRALRELAQYAPYEFIEILVNNDTYGGGGIFGQFSTAAAGNDWANYLFVHEFGHHFAGLADEYYTSAVAYETGAARPRPLRDEVHRRGGPGEGEVVGRRHAGYGLADRVAESRVRSLPGRLPEGAQRAAQGASPGIGDERAVHPRACVHQHTAVFGPELPRGRCLRGRELRGDRVFPPADAVPDVRPFRRVLSRLSRRHRHDHRPVFALT